MVDSVQSTMHDSYSIWQATQEAIWSGLQTFIHQQLIPTTPPAFYPGLETTCLICKSF